MKRLLNYHFWLALFVILLAIASASEGAIADEKPSLRIVGCEDKIRSRKRGVCANELQEADFKALAPGVSWYYNWHFETKHVPPAGVPMEFIPMVWGDGPAGLAGLEAYLAKGHRPRHVFAINEPNIRGESFLSPEQTAVLYRKIKAIADKYGASVVGPQMAIGSPAADSITAFDPLEKQEVTYTFMVPFLKAFLSYVDETQVRAIGIHPYDRAEGLRALVELTHAEFKRPVWVTEFNPSYHSPDVPAHTFLIQVTDYLERSPSVEGYAWFKERVPGHADSSLLNEKAGELSPLGEAYVAMPVHDADVHYRLPGRLQAENYVAVEAMQVWPTNDSDGFIHLASEAPGAWADYNIQVAEPGTYTLRCRVTGQPGKLAILRNDQVLATVDSTPPAPDQWTTMETPVALNAGPQTIRVRCMSAIQGLNWIEFTKRQ